VYTFIYLFIYLISAGLVLHLPWHLGLKDKYFAHVILLKNIQRCLLKWKLL